MIGQTFREVQGGGTPWSEGPGGSEIPPAIHLAINQLLWFIG
jgi:hypothetical protein